MWQDEAAVAVNVLNRGYGDLLGALRFHEAAPPLFLWVEKTAVLLLGDGVDVLRLPPFLASCAALPLLAWAAGRLLEARAVPWAVFLFAASEQLAWHACEAKPYAFDVLVAVALVALWAATGGGPLLRRLLLLAAPGPLLIFLSYPAAFLYGGVLAALAPAVWRERRASAWAAYGLLGAAVAASFLALLLGPIPAQHDPEIASWWANAFPEWSRPWSVPGWIVFSTFDVFRYCCKPLGQLLAPLAAIGAALTWRRQRALVILLALPPALALAASLLHRYPYGGARVLAYAAPALVLLVAAAMPPVWDWLARRHRLAPAALALLFLPPLVAAGTSVVRPWARPDAAGAAAYVLAHRRPTDRVTGNNWTHEYYFRGLGAAFRYAPATNVGERCWVVFTDECEADKRLQEACGTAPPGWVPVERREFEFTTVLLMERPGG
jgi:hypothetical protein